jgi:hypothetical protein
VQSIPGRYHGVEVNALLLLRMALIWLVTLLDRVGLTGVVVVGSGCLI